MNVVRRLDGTTVATFTIGLRGPTIWQGTTAPMTGDGKNGDLYVRQGATPSFYAKVNNVWTAIGVTTVFTRSTALRGVDLTVSSGDTMIAVLRNPYTTDSMDVTIDADDVTIDADAGATTNLTLPTGVEGKTLTIKDESGLASTFSIVVTGSNIDDTTTQTISTAYGLLELVYAGGAWRVVGR